MVCIDPWEALERLQAEVAAELRVMLGESVVPETNVTAADRPRRIEAMKLCAAGKLSDEERHSLWCRQHWDAGWVWGPEFDGVKKTHPNLKSWFELPASARSKARIFVMFSRTAALLSESFDPLGSGD
jgi:hypothetical protein